VIRAETSGSKSLPSFPSRSLETRRNEAWQPRQATDEAEKTVEYRDN